MIRRLALVLLLVVIALAQSPPPPDALALANIWEKANEKFDVPRTALLNKVAVEAHRGPFHPYWESLKTYQEPGWYPDAKFGIFIHWGIYSVPAFGSEWYSRQMYQKGSREYEHHLKTYGPQDKFGYKDFIPMFKAEHFDPQAWAHLFREAGAKYVVPVAEHHDGFPMYASDLTDWCAGKMGPKRDVLGELAAAIRAEGLHFGASSHRAEHDWFFDVGREIPSDVRDPAYVLFYGPAQLRLLKRGDDENLLKDWTYVPRDFRTDWQARTAEIVEKYHPDLLYFDWWIGQPSLRDQVVRFAAYYYNQGALRGTGAVINYKNDAFPEGAGTLDVERGQLTDIRPAHWQTDTSLGNKSWGYIADETYKTPELVIHQLADVVSKNGNLLLNIGPRADGTIPEQVQQTLREIGGWLKVNGEAIYGTRPWKKYGEGPTQVAGGAFHDTETKPYTAEDFRFTTKGDVLYAIELGWPKDGHATIHSMGSEELAAKTIRSVNLLGSDVKLEWRQQADGLHLALPAQKTGEYAWAFKIEMQARQP
jgi:alpha-L-fucosidase